MASERRQATLVGQHVSRPLRAQLFLEQGSLNLGYDSVVLFFVVEQEVLDLFGLFGDVFLRLIYEYILKHLLSVKMPIIFS